MASKSLASSSSGVDEGGDGALPHRVVSEGTRRARSAGHATESGGAGTSISRSRRISLHSANRGPPPNPHPPPGGPPPAPAATPPRRPAADRGLPIPPLPPTHSP